MTNNLDYNPEARLKDFREMDNDALKAQLEWLKEDASGYESSSANLYWILIRQVLSERGERV